MKHFNFLKFTLIIVLFGIGGSVSGQINPLAFGPHGIAGSTTTSDAMYYINYVGGRLMVTAPTVIAGEKLYTTSNDGGGGTGVWGGVVTTPIPPTDVIMCATDSLGCSIPVGSMTGKVALIWRGSCEFGHKALQAQNAGAIAIIIINQHAGEGPVGMGAGAVGTSVTIPVFMVGNLDGIAMSAQYGSAATGTPGTVKVAITPWGQGHANDLGFVPGGVAGWHNYATPAAQFMAGAATANAYKGIDVAFIANYGSSPATNVKVISSTAFTPTGGSSSVQHTDTTEYAGPFVGVVSLPGDDTRDSILSMITDEYNLTATGPGRFDVTYTITSDSADDFNADNTITSSFYLSDSVYCKSRYNFTAQKPIRNIGYTWGTGTPFVWGPFYYVAQGGSYFSKAQYSISGSGTAGSTIFLSGSSELFIFKWEDGANGQPGDSILQAGELMLKATGKYDYLAASDTSGADYTISELRDPGDNAIPNFALEANSWYYVAIGVGSSTGQTQYLGCDGILNPLVRVYGRGKINPRNMEYQSMVLGSTDDTATSASGNFAPMPGTQTSFVNNIDSFSFPNLKGMVPSVALVTRTTTIDPTPSHDGVNNVNRPSANVNLFPNPASSFVDVAVEFDRPVKNVTYKILDGLGRYVSQETTHNVSKETHRLNTSGLKAGFYYLIVYADDARIAKTFTITK